MKRNHISGGDWLEGSPGGEIWWEKLLRAGGRTRAPAMQGIHSAAPHETEGGLTAVSWSYRGLGYR